MTLNKRTSQNQTMELTFRNLFIKKNREFQYHEEESKGEEIIPSTHDGRKIQQRKAKTDGVFMKNEEEWGWELKMNG